MPAIKSFPPHIQCFISSPIGLVFVVKMVICFKPIQSVEKCSSSTQSFIFPGYSYIYYPQKNKGSGTRFWCVECHRLFFKIKAEIKALCHHFGLAMVFMTRTPIICESWHSVIAKCGVKKEEKSKLFYIGCKKIVMQN